MERFWLFIHLIAAMLWIGGMFFALYCLRPAAADLQPQQRAPLMVAALGRFFDVVLAAVVLIWISGIAMLAPVGTQQAPLGWHLMLAIGALMTIVFVVIRWALFPRARMAVTASDVPATGAVLERIRVLVVLNLVLGVLAVGLVVFVA